jgi:hypothetical protein
VRSHLLEGMRVVALHHTEMTTKIATLQVVVSSTVEFMLGRVPTKTLWVEVVHELVAEFQK